MIGGLKESITELVSDKGVSRELIQRTIERALLAAYKKTFGTDENAVVKFSSVDETVELFAQKTIVNEIEDEVIEILLEDALQLDDQCELGDSLLIEVDPKHFNRLAIQTAKQSAKQALRDIQHDTLFSEYKEKVGAMVVGYYQREKQGTIYIDLGNTEGILPKRFQSPRESYHVGDRIKALIYKVERTQTELQIILSRTHPEFVRRIFELEVPEIFDHTLEILKITREPGYRTKVIVRSNRREVDPVGACVGVRGVRILSVIRELEGEKIDIIKYSPDPRELIKNSLAPATIKHILLLDEEQRQALVVVPENQLSLCIGKMGLNVRLTSRLTDWSIEVKTEEQFKEMDISNSSQYMASALFTEEESEEISDVSELPNITDDLVSLLNANNITRIEDIVSLDVDTMRTLKGFTESDVQTLEKILKEGIEVVDSDDPTEEDSNELTVDQLPDIDQEIVSKLKRAGYKHIIDLVNAVDLELKERSELTEEEFQELKQIIEDSVNVIDEE